jgi:hypothetical protein
MEHTNKLAMMLGAHRPAKVVVDLHFSSVAFLYSGCIVQSKVLVTFDTLLNIFIFALIISPIVVVRRADHHRTTE